MPSPSGGGTKPIRYLDLYTDAECKNLWLSVPVIFTGYTTIDSQPSTVTIGDKTYKYFDGYGSRIRDIETIQANAPFLTSRNNVPNATTMYCKNGLQMTVQVSTTYGQISNLRVGNQILSIGQNSGATAETPAKCYCMGIQYNNTRYLGFTQWTQSNLGTVIIPTFFAEEAFWKDALKPAYDYSTQPDGNGGQGTGTLPDTGVHTTTHTGVMPSGGRGLHWYIITKAQYNDFQGYLWGEGDTIAKSLWQKFQNKTHSPVSCVVGCYTLPSVFMPTGTAGTAIHIAGITVPVAAYYFSPGYSENVVLDYGTPEPPFGSWLDYCGIMVKIHVPFCGEFATNPEQIWGRNVTVKYCVDHANGNLAALVKADDHVLAELTGNVAYTIPVAGGDTGTIERLGAVAIGALALGAAESGAAALTAISGAAAGVAGAQYKTHLTNSNLSGNVSSCTNGVGFIEYSKPFVDYPADYIATYGVPAAWNCGSLGNFAGGYGEFDVMASDIWIPNATDAEKDEIVKLIESGVIV